MQIRPSYNIYVDRFFREAWRRKDDLRSRINEIDAQSWRGRSKPDAPRLLEFVRSYEEALEDGGAFALHRNAPLDRLKIKSAKQLEIRAYAMCPLTMVQAADDLSGYTQDLVMLTQMGASLGSSKVTAYQSPLGLSFSRHALERLCERNKDISDVQQCLASNALSLAQRLAVLQITKTVKFADQDEESPKVSLFLPFFGGLMIFSSQYLTGKSFDENLGWKFSFTKSRYSYRNLKPELILDHQSFGSDTTTFRTWYATTFIGGDQLTLIQRQYVEAVNRMFETTYDETMNQAFEIQFDPDTIYRASRYKGLGEEIDEDHASSAAGLLREPAFKVPDRTPFGVIWEDGARTRDLPVIELTENITEP